MRAVLTDNFLKSNAFEDIAECFSPFGRVLQLIYKLYMQQTTLLSCITDRMEGYKYNDQELLQADLPAGLAKLYGKPRPQTKEQILKENESSCRRIHCVRCANGEAST